MDIRTKFNLKDFVFYIDNGKIQQGQIEKNSKSCRFKTLCL